MNLKSALLMFCSFLASNALTMDYAVEIETILQSYFEDQRPGISVAVVKKGEVVYEGSMGLAKLYPATPIHHDQIFRIGSITKQFTAVAIMQLVEKGILDLDDDVREFVPDLMPNGPAIKIHHLLNHTSGLGNQQDIPDYHLLERNIEHSNELVDAVKNTKLYFDPGFAYSYSNLGYYLLGHIVEVSTGLSYEEYLRANIIIKVGLDHTGFESDMMGRDNVVTGYSMENGHYQEAAFLNMKLPFAAGAMYSTTMDLYLWHRALFAEEVITKGSLKKCLARGITSDGQNIHYGYGWMLGDVMGSSSMKHDGIINGFTSFAVYLPEEEIFVAILGNCDCHGDLEIPASKIAALVLDRPFNYRGVGIDVSALEHIVGNYHSNSGNIMVGIEHDRFYIESMDGKRSRLIPQGENRFLVDSSLTIVAFDNDSRSMNMTTLGEELNWERVPKIYSLTDTSIQKYLGEYQVEDRFVLKIYMEGNKIFGAVDSDAHELTPIAEDKFIAKDIDATLTFRMEGEEITGLTLFQNGFHEAIKL